MTDEHEVGAWEHVYVYDQRNSKFEVVAATSQKAPLRFGLEVVRGVICQVRGVICQVERQRAGKSNAEA